MIHPVSITVSSDGDTAYVAGQQSHSIAIFDRDPATGELTQKSGTAGCISEGGFSDPMQAGTLGACQSGVGYAWHQLYCDPPRWLGPLCRRPKQLRARRLRACPRRDHHPATGNGGLHHRHRLRKPQLAVDRRCLRAPALCQRRRGELRRRTRLHRGAKRQPRRWPSSTSYRNRPLHHRLPLLPLRQRQAAQCEQALASLREAQRHIKLAESAIHRQRRGRTKATRVRAKRKLRRAIKRNRRQIKRWSHSAGSAHREIAASVANG